MSSQATSIQQLAHNLAELLDKVMKNDRAGFAVQEQLGALFEEWSRGSGSAEGRDLIQKAQGMVGFVNASHPDGPNRANAYYHLTEFKQQLRRSAASRE
jgi:hypothetical protein